MTRFSPYLLVPFLLAVALFQATVLPELTVLGVKPELMLLSVLAWSLLRGPEEGLVWAFLGGLMLDVLSGGPFGASTLALLAVSFFFWIDRAFGGSHQFSVALGDCPGRHANLSKSLFADRSTHARRCPVGR